MSDYWYKWKDNRFAYAPENWVSDASEELCVEVHDGDGLWKHIGAGLYILDSPPE